TRTLVTMTLLAIAAVAVRNPMRIAILPYFARVAAPSPFTTFSFSYPGSGQHRRRGSLYYLALCLSNINPQSILDSFLTVRPAVGAGRIVPQPGGRSQVSHNHPAR